mgnify:CR=1 FL=1
MPRKLLLGSHTALNVLALKKTTLDFATINVEPDLMELALFAGRKNLMVGSIAEWQQQRIQLLVLKQHSIRCGRLENLSSMQLHLVLQRERFQQDKARN